MTKRIIFVTIQKNSPILSFTIKSTKDVGISKSAFIAAKILYVFDPSFGNNIKIIIRYGIKLAIHKMKTVIMIPRTTFSIIFSI